jgi:hypothetical protein
VREHILIPFLIAPLGAIATLWLVAVDFLVLNREGALLRSAATWQFLAAFLAVGTPFAYGVTLVIGLPGYALLRRLVWINPGAILLRATMTDALAASRL